MIRIASDFFIPVFGSELIKDFETATAEPEIEDIYKFTYAKVSKCNIRTYKRYAPFSKASTDGLMECEYTDIPYNKYDVEDKTKLHEMWKDIYKHCIE